MGTAWFAVGIPDITFCGALSSDAVRLVCLFYPVLGSSLCTRRCSLVFVRLLIQNGIEKPGAVCLQFVALSLPRRIVACLSFCTDAASVCLEPLPGTPLVGAAHAAFALGTPAACGGKLFIRMPGCLA